MDLTAQTAAAIEAIYDTVLDLEAWPRALRALRELVGGEGANLFQLDCASGTVPFWVDENLPPGGGSEYERRLHSINPHIGPTLAGPTGMAHWDYRLLDEAELDRHEFYDGIQRLAGVRYFVGMSPLRADGRSLLTSIQRTRRQGHVSAQEIALYAQVAPHIGHAFRLAGAHARSRTDAALLHLLDQRRREAVLLLDIQGRLIEANGEARRILALDDGLRSLRAWKAGDCRTLDGLVAGALATASGRHPGGGGVMALPRPSGALPYLLRVIPWPRGTVDPVRRPSAVVLVRDPERAAAVGTGELAALLGLSEREAALALRLARGDSLQAGATALGISHNTARVHLRNIFEKTGVNSQRDLLRLMLSAP